MYALLTLLKYLARGWYALLKLFPVQQKVVLMSRRQSATSTDFRLLADYIYRKHPDYSVVILNHKMKNKYRHVLDILGEMYHLATAKAVVVDSYNISVSILNHRPELIIVQIWHALGAIKEFGHQVIGRKEGSSHKIAKSMHMHRNYTYVTCGGEPMVSVFAAAFAISPERVKPIGMPRVDYLLDPNGATKASRQFIKKHAAQLQGRKVIFYAPTFRKKAKIHPRKLIEALDTKKYVLVIKQHIHDKTTIKPQAGVIIEKDIDTLDILPAADYVITDYSATAFEAAVLQKPLFFWAYDREKYAHRRGFALEYDTEMPGVISTSATRIMKAIEQNETDPLKVHEFAKRYVKVQDGTSTQQIVQLLDL